MPSLFHVDLKKVSQIIEAGRRLPQPTLLLYTRRLRISLGHDEPAKLGAKFTAIIGSEEMARGVVRLKDMASGEQSTVKLDEVVSWLCERLGG